LFVIVFIFSYSARRSFLDAPRGCEGDSETQCNRKTKGQPRDGMKNAPEVLFSIQKGKK
jgi:hypothetical protein